MKEYGKVKIHSSDIIFINFISDFFLKPLNKCSKIKKFAMFQNDRNPSPLSTEFHHFQPTSSAERRANEIEPKDSIGDKNFKNKSHHHGTCLPCPSMRVHGSMTAYWSLHGLFIPHMQFSQILKTGILSYHTKSETVVLHF